MKSQERPKKPQKKVAQRTLKEKRTEKKSKKQASGYQAAHQSRTSAKRWSARAPKSGSRVSFARVVAGLVMPQRKRARCLGSPSASGCSAWSTSSARRSTTVSGVGRGDALGSSCASPSRQKLQ